MFFILLFFAAFSSVIGMLEPVVSWLEEHKAFSRPKMAILAGSCGWVLGIAALLSFNVWSDLKLLSFVPLVAGKGIFELLDFLVSNLMIPFNAMLIAVFAGLDNVEKSAPGRARFAQQSAYWIPAFYSSICRTRGHRPDLLYQSDLSTQSLPVPAEFGADGCFGPRYGPGHNLAAGASPQDAFGQSHGLKPTASPMWMVRTQEDSRHRKKLQ